MSLPTEAEIQTDIGLVLKTLDETRKFGNVNATNFLALWEAYVASISADSSPAAQSAAEGMRAQLAAMLAPSVGQNVLAPLWLTYSRVKELPWTDTASIIRALFVDFAEAGTPVTVTSRGYTYGSPAVVSATGTGEVVRCTVDSYNYTIESPLIAESKVYECIADEHTVGGTRHAETFLVRGEAFGKDIINITGTGGSATVAALNPYGATSPWVRNAGFESFSPSSGTLTDLTNWTVTTIGSLQMVTGTPGNEVYQDALPQFTTPYAIRMTGNNAISQSFSTQQLKWNPALPMFCQVAFKRESSCDGTLTITVGDKTASVALSAQSGWTILRFSVAQDAWFRRWNKVAADPSTVVVKIELSGRTTGTLLLDSFILAPFTPIWDGSFVAITSGTTPWKRGDKWSATDTCSENGVIQKWMARTYGGYLPHSGSPTWNGSVT